MHNEINPNVQETVGAINEFTASLRALTATLPGATSGEDIRRAVLQNLFASDAAMKSLGAALRECKGEDGAIEAVNNVLSELNDTTQPPSNPGFSGTQCEGLRSLFHEPNLAKVSPYIPATGSIAHQAKALWTSMLSLEPGGLRGFHDSVVAYRNDPSDPKRLETVLGKMTQMAPQFTWTVEHAVALAGVQSDDPKFRALSWYDIGTAFW